MGQLSICNWNGICWGLLFQLVQLIKIHFLPHLESFMWKRKFEKKFFKKSPLGYSPFANYHLQMGVTVLGFAEHFGPILIRNFVKSAFNSCKPSMKSHPEHIISNTDEVQCKFQQNKVDKSIAKSRHYYWDPYLFIQKTTTDSQISRLW